VLLQGSQLALSINGARLDCGEHVWASPDGKQREPFEAQGKQAPALQTPFGIDAEPGCGHGKRPGGIPVECGGSPPLFFDEASFVVFASRPGHSGSGSR
jgi:hypothetical protein